MKLPVILMLSSLSLLGACLQAETVPAQGMNRPAFTDFDTDQDGYLSETELNTGRAQRIGERAAAGRQMRNVANAEPFADIDTSKDGKIDPAEFAAHQLRERQPAQR